MKTALLLISLCLIVGSPVWASNIVLNGGFETGNFSNWTTGGNWDGNTGVIMGAFPPYSGAQQGSYYSIWGAVGSDATISQVLTTTPGMVYNFSFWIAAHGDNPSDIHAYWDSTQLTFSNPNTGSQWTQFWLTVTGTGTDTIRFALRDDPAWIALDNISVTQAVPEPATLGLLAAGLIAIAVGRRHRRA